MPKVPVHILLDTGTIATAWSSHKWCSERFVPTWSSRFFHRNNYQVKQRIRVDANRGPTSVSEATCQKEDLRTNLTDCFPTEQKKNVRFARHGYFAWLELECKNQRPIEGVGSMPSTHSKVAFCILFAHQVLYRLDDHLKRGRGSAPRWDFQNLGIRF